jgi:DNA polymerase III epsilon subunit-like protein
MISDQTFLIFDTETTGLSKTLDNGKRVTPYIVQLSWVLYDDNSKTPINVVDRIIKLPEDIEIDETATKIHGLTKKDTMEKGIPIDMVLEEFNDDLNKASCLVGHNIDFDKRIIIEEYKRNNKFNYKLSKLPVYCTMSMGTSMCNLKYKNKSGQEKPKPPKLKELYKYLFNIEPNEKKLHNAMIDVWVTWRCFCKMYLKYDLIEDYDPLNLHEGFRKYYNSLL